MQYSKLFAHAGVEYITPFVKLWMSFNNWYKSELSVSSDRDAIDICKKPGIFRKKYDELYYGKNAISEDFLVALENFAIAINENKWGTLEFSSDLFENNPSKEKIKRKMLNHISSIKKYYIVDSDADRLFEEVIESVYDLRNQIMHGDFDITDTSYLSLVEDCYKVLYPILDKVFLESENRTYICTSRKGTEAYGKLDGKKMIVLKGSKICEPVNDSLPDKALNNRNELLKFHATRKDKVYLLMNDIDFNSPSAASTFCLGTQSSGQKDWKTKDGQEIKYIDEEAE